MRNLWTKLKTWASGNSKAIGAAVGSVASYVFLQITGKDLDPAAVAVIVMVVAAAVTWLFPANSSGGATTGGTES